MKRLVLLTVVFAAVAAGTAGVEAGGKGKGDKAKLQGTWEVTSIQFGGKKIDLPPGAKMAFTFDGDKVSFDDGKMKKQGTYKLDETKKPPQIQILEGDEVKMNGIYQIDGDTLKLAGGMGPKAPVPTSFDDEK